MRKMYYRSVAGVVTEVGYLGEPFISFLTPGSPICEHRAKADYSRIVYTVATLKGNNGTNPIIEYSTITVKEFVENLYPNGNPIYGPCKKDRQLLNLFFVSAIHYLNLNLEQSCDYFGITKAYMINMRNNKRMLSKRLLRATEKAYGITLCQFLTILEMEGYFDLVNNHPIVVSALKAFK